jgi:hypothetical protein
MSHDRLPSLPDSPLPYTMERHEAANRVLERARAHYNKDLVGGYPNRLAIKEEMEE